MREMGQYEILSHVAMPECSIRIIGMREAEHVASHYHENSTHTPCWNTRWRPGWASAPSGSAHTRRRV